MTEVRRMLKNTAEIRGKQSRIIQIQADVINDLYGLLMQHITVEEAEALPAVAKINLAANIRSTIEE